MEKISDEVLEIILSDPWTADTVAVKDLAAELLQARQDVATLTAEMANTGREFAEHCLKNRWIPVSERLPDDGEGVLISGDDISFLRGVGIAFHVTKIPQWSTDDGYYFHGDSYKRVTHWMPLPIPPEGGEENVQLHETHQ
jgi:hypothetical protein